MTAIFCQKKSWHRPIFAAGCPTTIVGAELFHYPVRNGKEWFQFAQDTSLGILTIRCKNIKKIQQQEFYRALNSIYLLCLYRMFQLAKQEIFPLKFLEQSLLLVFLFYLQKL